MRARTVLLFGTKFDMVARLKSLGLKVVLVDEVKNSEADISLIVDGPKASLGDYNVQDFERFQGQIDGVIVCLEDYVELAAATRERYFKHLLGITLSQARVVRDKYLLKKFLQENSIPVAKFSEIDSFERLKEQLGLPFIIKPRLGYLAQGIEIVSSKSEFEKWYSVSQDKLAIFYAEEFIRNPIEYCCDTIVASSQVVVQFPGEYTVNCLESNKTHKGFGVNFPGFLPIEKLEEIKLYTRKFIEKLGVTDGFFHTEFLWDGEKWYFGESGCRLPGGLQIPVQSYMSGLDILDYYIKMFVSELRPKEIVPVKIFRKAYAGYYLYPKHAGIVEKIENNIHGTPGILNSAVYISEGDVVDHEDSSVSMVANVIYEAESQNDLKEWTLKAPELFKVKYR
ncbi:MAG: hypothetical protein R3A80_13070 [Bdellovibrionota bacterium]